MKTIKERIMCLCSHPLSVIIQDVKQLPQPFRFSTYLGFIILFVLSLSMTLPVVDLRAEEGQPVWKWTKENPKPDWWPYDHLTEKPELGGYLTVASNQYIGLMNPNHWPVNDWVSITYLYGGLFYVDGKYKPVFPWLAESLSYEDATTLVMKLRKGITFHDGTDFNAQSLKYQIDWINNPKNGAWDRAWIEPVKSLTVVDSHTLKWEFKRPWAGFLGMMATVPGYAISEKALRGDEALREIKKLETRIQTAEKKLDRQKKKVEKAQSEVASTLGKEQEKMKSLEQNLAELKKDYEENAKLAEGTKPLDLHPVGTGRYMFEEGSPGNYLKLTRNPNWWFGKAIGRPEMPYVDGYKVIVIPDRSIQLANLRAGKIDFMQLSAAQYNMLKNDPQFKITGQEANRLVSLQFNHAKGPCQDIRVRKAISHALDRKALIHGVRFGNANMASVIFNTKHWCHNPNIEPVTYDPELSKKLLAEAGYSKGVTVRGYFNHLPEGVTLANAIKNMLNEVNINWDVEFLDPTAASDRDKNIDYDLAEGGWSYIKEPDMIANGLYHPSGNWNHGRSFNKKAIALIEAGLTETDLEKRQKIYWELEQALYDNYEDAWLWYPINFVASQQNLMGFDMELSKKGGEAYWFSYPLWFKGGKK